jgi:quercetin dioxygenase-like cupin family protein
MSKLIMMIAALATMATVGLATAQQPAGTGTTPSMAPIKRTLLQKVDVPGSNYETVTGIAEIIPNVNVGRHTHPGPETGYVLEGKLTLLVDGKPPQTLKPGDSYQVPPVAVHDARSGDKGAKIMAVYIVEKGKPLASPAP